MNNDCIKLKRSIEKKVMPLVRGIGIDIEDVKRFRAQEPTKHAAFYRKIFTEKEILYCMSKSDPYPHFTARFAAKEAVAKAIGATMYELGDIEIINETKGHCALSGEARSGGRPTVAIRSHQAYEVEVSLSHTKDQGAAIAIWLR